MHPPLCKKMLLKAVLLHTAIYLSKKNGRACEKHCSCPIIHRDTLCVSNIIVQIVKSIYFKGGQAPMINPVVKVRKEKGLSVTQLAILAGVTSARIRQVEQGDAVRLSGNVLGALEQLGYDPERLNRDYTVWRSAQIAKILRWAEKGA